MKRFLLALSLLISHSVLSLGFGELELKSEQGEPLDARIVLVNLGEVDLTTITVELASAEAHAAAQIPFEQNLSQLAFRVQSSVEHDAVVRVTSKDPISADFMQFLVDMAWPQGQLQSEYTISLKLPDTAAASSVTVELAQTFSATVIVRKDDTGSDDGQIHVTKDGGASWQLISDSLTKGRPDDLWVSRVFASNHKKSRVYASLNGYRNDDFTPYLFVSEDYGATWEAIDSGLPMQPINVVVEDPHNEELLFVGNDHGLYASIDRGKHWIPFNQGMPAVAVHDLKIQPEAKDLVVGTHGRSIYKVNISELEQLNPSILESSVHLFAPQKIRASSRWGRSWSAFGTPYNPSTSIKWYQEQAGPARITVELDGANAFTAEVQGIKGLQEWSYSLNLDNDLVKSFEKKSKKSVKAASDGTYYLPKGNYILRISNGKAESKQPLIIE